MPNFRKNTLEQFYTIPDVANECVKFMIEKIGKEHKWIEPTAGTGSFLDALEFYGVSQYQAFDIDPKDSRIKRSDFRKESFKEFDYAFIGNPPFGRACSLAIKIFNHCAKFAKFIGFIVPKSFNKVSIQDQLNLNFHLMWSMACPPVSFKNENGEVYGGETLQTEFQIWQLQDQTPRSKMQQYRSSTFRFVKKSDDYDLCFRTHGSGAGKVLEPGNYNPRTTAFIKIIDPVALDGIRNADFSYYRNQVSYIPCLSPAEISLCVDEWIKNNK